MLDSGTGNHFREKILNDANYVKISGEIIS